MVTDVENSRLSRPAPISRSGQIASGLSNPLYQAASQFAGHLIFMGACLCLCVVALAYAVFTRDIPPNEVEKSLLIASPGPTLV